MSVSVVASVNLNVTDKACASVCLCVCCICVPVCPCDCVVVYVLCCGSMCFDRISKTSGRRTFLRCDRFTGKPSTVTRRTRRAYGISQWCAQSLE